MSEVLLFPQASAAACTKFVGFMWAFQGPDDQAHVFYTIWSWGAKIEEQRWARIRRTHNYH